MKNSSAILINRSRRGRKSGGICLRLGERDYFLQFLHSHRIETAGLRRNRPEHGHALYHFIAVYRGEGTFLLNGKPQKVNPGSVLLISPGQTHSLGVTDGEEVQYGEITFEFLADNGDTLYCTAEKLLSQICGTDLSVPAVEEKGRTAAFELIDRALGDLEKLRDCQGNEPYFHLSSSSVIFNLIVSLSGYYAQVRSGENSISPMEKIKQYIEANYQRPLTLEDLSLVGSYNTKYLSRRFRELYGETPIYYRDSLRIESAARLLKQTNYTVGEIAEKCGFSDIYYFSRIFRKRTGKRPGEYRKAD